MTKFFKVMLVMIMLVINVWVQPEAWADAGKLMKSTDYTEVTQAISALTQAKDNPDETTSPEQRQLKLANLQLQKYILETAEGPATCRNATDKTLGVYLRPKKTPADQPGTLYYLGSNQTTDDDLACQGVLLPTGTKVAFSPLEAVQELVSPLGFRIVDGTQFVINQDPQTGVVEFNIPPAQSLKAGESNWAIPTTLTQADVDAQAPNAPQD